MHLATNDVVVLACLRWKIAKVYRHMQKHEKWIDASKGLLIFLVVAGHAFGAASHIGDDAFIMNVHENIYKVNWVAD